MSVIARFEVIPVRDGSMSTAIASALRALDRHPVTYETTATGTVVEADSVERIFAAIQAAHQAIPEDRVITSVEVDEDRRRPQNMNERVAAVERELGHPPRKVQPQRGGGGQPATGAAQPARGQSSTGQPSPPVQSQQTRPVQSQRAQPGRTQPAQQPPTDPGR